MFFRRLKVRQFEYLPRFYNPDKDERENLRKRLRQERTKQRSRRRIRPVYYWGILFLLIIYFYLYLSGQFR